MRLIETISKWLRSPTELDTCPFEMLVEEYQRTPQEVYGEFIRRLNKLVFQAAMHSVSAKGQGVEAADVEALVIDVFSEFSPEFESGSPANLLARFASIIRRILGATAFEKIALRYYCLLPIFHIADVEQLKFLAASYEDGLRPGFENRLAERFGVSSDYVLSILPSANEAFMNVITKEFSRVELLTLTEGYLPDGVVGSGER